MVSIIPKKFFKGVLYMHTITNINEQELHEIAQMDIGRAAVLFTSPFCGTCKVAEKMLEIAAHLGVPAQLYKANINFTPYFREQWQIRSIPALILIKNGKVVEQIYAMKSVDVIHEKLLQL